MEVVGKNHWTMLFEKDQGFFCPAGKVRRLNKHISIESPSKSGSVGRSILATASE